MEVEGILFSAQETCFFTYRGEDWMLTRLVRLFPLKLVDVPRSRRAGCMRKCRKDDNLWTYGNKSIDHSRQHRDGF